MPTDSEVQEFAAGLYRRLLAGDGIYPIDGTRQQVQGWTPRPHRCHDNVDFFVAHAKTAKAVRGFVFFAFDHRLPLVQFSAHSLIDIGGKLIDITPHGASQVYPFIRFLGADAEFAVWMRLGELHLRRENIPSEEVEG